LLTASAVLYPLIFSAFLVLEKPGLGLGHFYYIPIAMIALANGPSGAPGPASSRRGCTRSGS
jgi:hypothetical protein